MNRRERLLASIIGPEMDETKAKMLDTTIKFILGDMGMQYTKLWALEGPGVMVFQPNVKEKSMFYLTLEQLNSAKAGYIINDKEGMRYFEVDYNELTTP